MSEKLKRYFPDIVPIIRPEVYLQKIFDPDWKTGFVHAQGCFYVNVQKYIYKSDTNKTDKIWLTFQITLHSRDILLMESIIAYLNCGRVATRNSSPAVDFLVNSFTDIQTKVIFKKKKYPLQSVKKMDFKDFCKVAQIIGNKEHLTSKGINEIKIIKNGMNKKRLN